VITLCKVIDSKWAVYLLIMMAVVLSASNAITFGISFQSTACSASFKTPYSFRVGTEVDKDKSEMR